MPRPLKYHESKLLKKVNFVQADSSREIAILRRYHIQRREDYTKWAMGTARGLACARG